MNNYFILVDENGCVRSKAINISGSKFQMIEVTKEIYDSLDRSIITSYRYQDGKFVFDGAYIPKGPMPIRNPLDDLRLAVAELAELFMGGA